MVCVSGSLLSRTISREEGSGYLVQKAGYMTQLKHKGLCSNKMLEGPVCDWHCRQDTTYKGPGTGLLMNQGYNGRIHLLAVIGPLSLS